MIKMLGAILVLISTYAIGSLLALQIKEREKWLRDIKMSVFLLMGELEYNQMPLAEALELTGRRHGGRLETFFKTAAEELRKKEGISVKEIWQQKSKEALKDSPLLKEQREEFSELGLYFTEADREARKKSVEFYLSRLEEDLKGLRENGADKAYLCRTLGMLGGIFILILVL